MAKLAYKTRGNSNPQGKERVFFTCHPEDFNIYFESICEEIFQTQNCAIWYDEESETAWDPAESRRNLGVRFEKLGDVYEEYFELEEAEVWYEKALGIREALSRETGTVESRRDLSISYNKLGNISQKEGNLSEAKAWYEKALKIKDVVSQT